jgi:hypothetical protein
MARDIIIGGVPFRALTHRDGRFLRAAGLFAFARREADGTYMVLHLELTASISLSAGGDHPRWPWALRQGMDSLLVHLLGEPAHLPGNIGAETETVLWHAGAQVRLELAEASSPRLQITQGGAAS